MSVLWRKTAHSFVNDFGRLWSFWFYRWHNLLVWLILAVFIGVPFWDVWIIIHSDISSLRCIYTVIDLLACGLQVYLGMKAKNTKWTELSDATFVEFYGEGSTRSALVSHPALGRRRYFRLSAAGNWYWRDTRRQRDAVAVGYIIKD